MKLFKFSPLIFASIVLIIAIFLKINEINILHTTILAVTTFLLGIFIAFSISDRHKRIDELRENDSIERAELVLLNNYAEQFGKKEIDKIKNVIDEYLIATLDYSIWDYFKTEPNFKKIVDTVCSIKPKNKQQSILFGNMLSILDSIGIARKKTIGIIQDRLSKFEWSIFILLSSIIIVNLLLINVGSIESIIIISIISLSIFLILNLLSTLDNLSWKEESRIFEPYQQTFESIGLMRYYPKDLITQKRVKNHSKQTYRIGIFPRPYPDLSDKEIQIIVKQN